MSFQISGNLPDIRQATPERSAIEQLFMDMAGPNQEIGWMELKRILGEFDCYEFNRIKLNLTFLSCFFRSLDARW